MAQLGADCKLYHNTGTYDTPVWDEVPLVRDLTLNLDAGKVDATTRGGSGFRQYLPGLTDASIDFGIIWDTSDTDFAAFQTAFNGKTTIDVAAMDGDIETSGQQGLRAEMIVSNFSRNEQLADVVQANVQCAPGLTENAPVWMTVA